MALTGTSSDGQGSRKYWRCENVGRCDFYYYYYYYYRHNHRHRCHVQHVTRVCCDVSKQALFVVVCLWHVLYGVRLFGRSHPHVASCQVLVARKWRFWQICFRLPLFVRLSIISWPDLLTGHCGILVGLINWMSLETKCPQGKTLAI
jgi:hypothetical protein